jgi:hypothetical protein
LVVAVSSSGVTSYQRQIGLFLLVLVDYFKLGVDHVSVGAASAGTLLSTVTGLRLGLGSGLRACAG